MSLSHPTDYLEGLEPLLGVFCPCCKYLPWAKVSIRCTKAHGLHLRWASVFRGHPTYYLKGLQPLLGTFFYPFRPLLVSKYLKKWQKRRYFHIPHQIAWPPGDGSQKLTTPAVGLGPKIIPTKFRPNLLTFRATLGRKTGEFRRAHSTSGEGVASRLKGVGGCAPRGGALAIPLLHPNTPQKGSHLASLSG